MTRVIWSPRAAADLEAICEFIARDSEYYAQLVAQRIVAIVEATADFPDAGSIVPEFDDPDVREKFVHRYRSSIECDTIQSRLSRSCTVHASFRTLCGFAMMNRLIELQMEGSVR